jgi:hypothetical protein
LHRWQPPVLDEMITQFRNYAAAYAHPSAKRHVFHGLAGPVNAVEVDGTVFIENDDAEAEAEKEASRSKALKLASEVASKAAAISVASEVAPAPSEVAPAASELAPAPKPAPEPAAALDSEPSCSVVTSSAADPITYSAAASKPPVGPKPSVAAFQLRSAASSKFPAGLKLKRSAPASQPAVVLTPLEVDMDAHACTYL